MSEDGTDSGRRRFLLGSTSVVGVAGVVGAVVPFVGSWNPSAKARAAGAPVRVDISTIEEGAILGPIPAWRGRPIFVVRRTAEALAALPQQDERLQDPSSTQQEQPEYATNAHRSRNPELLVLVGLCPHLFCSPTPHIEVRAEAFDADWKVDKYNSAAVGSEQFVTFVTVSIIMSASYLKTSLSCVFPETNNKSKSKLSGLDGSIFTRLDLFIGSTSIIVNCLVIPGET